MLCYKHISEPLSTFVSGAAHTHQLVGVGQQVAAVSELAAAARPVGTQTGPTVAA